MTIYGAVEEAAGSACVKRNNRGRIRKWDSKSLVAGYTSDAGNPLLADFTLVAKKLEQLGFTYFKGKVTIVEPIEESK